MTLFLTRTVSITSSTTQKFVLKFAHVNEAPGDLSAQIRSVYRSLEDTNTAATSCFAAGVEFYFLALALALAFF